MSMAIGPFLARMRQQSASTSQPAASIPPPASAAPPVELPHPASFPLGGPSRFDLLRQRNMLIDLLRANNIAVPEDLAEMKRAPKLMGLPKEVLARIARIVIKDTWLEYGSREINDIVSSAFGRQPRDGNLASLRACSLLFEVGVMEVLRAIPIKIDMRPVLYGSAVGSLWTKKRKLNEDDQIELDCEAWLARQPSNLIKNLIHADIALQLGSFNGKEFNGVENGKLLEKTERLLRLLPMMFPKMRTVYFELHFAPRTDVKTGGKVWTRDVFEVTMIMFLKALKDVKVGGKYVALDWSWEKTGVEKVDLGEMKLKDAVDRMWEADVMVFFKF